ncbi:hypothetical protein NFI96_006443 [Prochilodus magdalenae]|nr:hypothetical protein NFI96_006443 [Prochilodus magdalenae]
MVVRKPVPALTGRTAGNTLDSTRTDSYSRNPQISDGSDKPTQTRLIRRRGSKGRKQHDLRLFMSVLVGGGGRRFSGFYHSSGVWYLENVSSLSTVLSLLCPVPPSIVLRMFLVGDRTEGSFTEQVSRFTHGTSGQHNAAPANLHASPGSAGESAARWSRGRGHHTHVFYLTLDLKLKLSRFEGPYNTIRTPPTLYPLFQYPLFQYPLFQYPLFQYPLFQYPLFQYLLFQYPLFQYLLFQYPLFQYLQFQYPLFQYLLFQYPLLQYLLFQYLLFQYPLFQYPLFQYLLFQYPLFQYLLFQYLLFQYLQFQYPLFQGALVNQRCGSGCDQGLAISGRVLVSVYTVTQTELQRQCGGVRALRWNPIRVRRSLKASRAVRTSNSAASSFPRARRRLDITVEENLTHPQMYVRSEPPVPPGLFIMCSLDDECVFLPEKSG